MLGARNPFFVVFFFFIYFSILRISVKIIITVTKEKIRKFEMCKKIAQEKLSGDYFSVIALFEYVLQHIRYYLIMHMFLALFIVTYIY